MISDTSAQNPKVWNDTTVFYNLIITDSLGCSVVDDVFEVYVNPTSTNEVDEFSCQIYPNPTSRLLYIEVENQIEEIKLFNLNGNLVKATNELEIDLMDLSDGIYILQIAIGNGKIIRKKIFKGNMP